MSSHAESESKSSELTADSDADLDAAFHETHIPVPKPKAKNAHPVTNRAPTVDEVMSPSRPDMSNASPDVVMGSIERIVTDIYDQVLEKRLLDLEKSLAATRPPPETPLAMALLGWVVEEVATFTIGKMGSLAVTAIEERFSKAAADGATDLLKIGKKKGGEWMKERVTERPKTAPDAAQAPATRAKPGEPLLAEFIERQRLQLRAHKNDAITTLELVRADAAKNTQDFTALDDALRSLLGSPELSGWFSHKVAMEWINFVARVSLGPQASGQWTDMPGANEVGGIAANGPHAQAAWIGTEGMVEVTIEVPDDVDGGAGLSIGSLEIPSSFGASKTLRNLNSEIAPDGKPYSVDSMPVYRRIWLKTGKSKVSKSPAFVITPEGKLEVDVSNSVLAAIGAGHRVHVGEQLVVVGDGMLSSEDERKDPSAWTRGANVANQCFAGAQIVRSMLVKTTPEKLQ